MCRFSAAVVASGVFIQLTTCLLFVSHGGLLLLFWLLPHLHTLIGSSFSVCLDMQVHCSAQEAFRLAVCFPDLWLWAAPVLHLVVLEPLQGRHQGRQLQVSIPSACVHDLLLECKSCCLVSLPIGAHKVG